MHSFWTRKNKAVDECGKINKDLQDANDKLKKKPSARSKT